MQTDVLPRTAVPTGPRLFRGLNRHTVYALGAIWLFQIIAFAAPGNAHSPESDEAAYIVIGHDMLAHLFGGTVYLPDAGRFLSGAPAGYPVLAAIGDNILGVTGARLVSLLCCLALTLFVLLLSRDLLDERAGIWSALVIATGGTTIYLARLAVYDAQALMLLAAGTVLLVRAVQRPDGRIWPFTVGAAFLFTLAIFTKYGTAVFVPASVLLALTAGWPQVGPRALRRAGTTLALTFVLACAAWAVWGRGISDGLSKTTLMRSALDPQSPSWFLTNTWNWMPVALVLFVLGTPLVWQRSKWLALALLLGACLPVVAQMRIGDGTSFAKHLTFGLLYAAVPAGAFLAWLWQRHVLGKFVCGLCAVALVTSGLLNAHWLLTRWPNDQAVVSALRPVIADHPHDPILGEDMYPELYALRKTLAPGQLVPLTRASSPDVIDKGEFGTIYLNLSSAQGRRVEGWITRPGAPYRFVERVTRRTHGQRTYWVIYERSSP